MITLKDPSEEKYLKGSLRSEGTQRDRSKLSSPQSTMDKIKFLHLCYTTSARLLPHSSNFSWGKPFRTHAAGDSLGTDAATYCTYGLWGTYLGFPSAWSYAPASAASTNFRGGPAVTTSEETSRPVGGIIKVRTGFPKRCGLVLSPIKGMFLREISYERNHTVFYDYNG
jgi:hypothetical protein